MNEFLPTFAVARSYEGVVLKGLFEAEPAELLVE